MYTCIYNMYNTDTYVHTSKLCVRIHARTRTYACIHAKYIFTHKTSTLLCIWKTEVHVMRNIANYKFILAIDVYVLVTLTIRYSITR